jgi:hypothetical protein
MSKPKARRADGLPVHPGEGVVPIMKELQPGQLKIIGTGFWITRYGLLATAKHVVEDLMDDTGGALGAAYVCHLAGDDVVHLRKIRRAHLLASADVAIAQADNFVEKYPDGPLMNLRAPLSALLPAEGTRLVTYAYPENRTLDFDDKRDVPTIRGDYFQGGFLRYVQQSEHPFLRFPYFETTVELRGGASGGPVFDELGRVIGVNCRGWDFRGSEFEGDSLSYMVPVELFLDLEVDTFLVPPKSWEGAQLPAGSSRHTVRNLGRLGHIDLTLT